MQTKTFTNIAVKETTDREFYLMYIRSVFSANVSLVVDHLKPSY